MNILIIQVLRMGDALQLLPIIQGIKQVFPKGRVSLLTSRLGAAILEGEPDIEQVFVLHKEEIVALTETCKKDDAVAALDQLATDLDGPGRIKWDWVINFSYTFSTALLSFLLEAKYRSGFQADRHRRYISKEKWFAHSMASFVNRRYSNFNWVDINKYIVGIKAVPGPPYTEPAEADLTRAASLWQQNGFEKHKTVGMHPGASGDYKRWPIEKFAELGRTLVKDHGFKIAILGDKNERCLGRELKSRIGDNVLDLTGKTDLKELKAALSLCRMLVTNDTGPMHLSAAVGTPVCALFFSTHFVETGPKGAGHVALCPDIDCFPCQGTARCTHKKCLAYITPQTVEAAVTRGRAFQAQGGADFLGLDKGKVRAYFSAFDPWQNLEWVPLDRRPPVFEDLERMMLKLAWLDFCLNTGPDAAEQDEHLRRWWRYFGTPHASKPLAEKLQKSEERFAELNNLFNKAAHTAMAIQVRLLEGVPEAESVKALGRSLEITEKEITELGQGSVVSFLGELLTVFQENLEKADALKLSTQTLGLYQDMQGITGNLIKRGQALSALITGKTEA